jgi:glycosyltransferase involved in cell wall biosynthesis
MTPPSRRHGIFVDLQAAQSLANAERGIARYSVELTRAMLAQGAPIEAVALSPSLPNPTRLPTDLATSPLLTWNTARTFDDVRSRHDRPLAYQVMSPMEAQMSVRLTLPLSAMSDADALVMVWYDLIPLVFAERYLPEGRAREPYMARLEIVKQADLLLAISEHSRRDLIEYLGVHPDRVAAIGGGVSGWFRPPASGEQATRQVRTAVPSIDRPFVLTVAGWEWRKNTDVLIRGFAGLPRDVRDDLQLVVACAVGPQGEAEWRDEAARAGLRDDQFVVTGFVDEVTLRALYQSCRLFVFPSKYEGYGLPVAEAARCGAAVVTSSSSSLPEILEMPASTFPPDDADAMADVMTAALTDQAFRAELLVAGVRASETHTWENVARRAVDAYERLDARMPPRRRRPRRHRVAFVGPFFPAHSGVAVYNSRVLDALDADDLAVELFAEKTHIGAWSSRLDLPVFPAEHLGSRINPYDYDSIVYTLGNSDFHLDTYELARRVPGIVWLHDINLVGLHFERAKRLAWWDLMNLPNLLSPSRTPEDAMRQELALAYGDRASPYLLRHEPLGYQAYVDRGALMSPMAVRNARHVICNSTVAERMLRLDLGPLGQMPPCTVVPLGVPDAPGTSRHDRTSDRERPLVVSLGIVDAKKRPIELVEAVAAAPRPLDLAFVGACGDGLRSEIEEVAARHHMLDRVTFTGFVDDVDYWDWLAQASVAVQLRSISFGESSAAVNDAVAASVPTITSVLSCADLPDGVVHMVETDASVAVIASALDTLVNDGVRRREMQSACEAYAKRLTFGHVAERIAEIIRSDAGRRGATLSDPCDPGVPRHR